MFCSVHRPNKNAPLAIFAKAGCINYTVDRWEIGLVSDPVSDRGKINVIIEH